MASRAPNNEAMDQKDVSPAILLPPAAEVGDRHQLPETVDIQADETNSAQFEAEVNLEVWFFHHVHGCF